MALLWIDGFDHYTTTNGADFPDVEGGAYAVNHKFEVRTMPELGGFGIRTTNFVGNAHEWGRKVLPSAVSSGVLGVGFHYYLHTGELSNSSNTYGIVSFRSAGGAGLYHIGFSQGSNSFGTPTLSIYQGTNTTPIATSVSTLSENTLFHIEVQIGIASGTGYIEARVNGETYVRADNLTTNGTAIAGVSLMSTVNGNTSWNQGHYYDNLYIYDGTGSVNNDWLGERNVFTLMPDGDSLDQDWTPSAGSDGYAMIDEIPADDGATYVESTTVGDTSNFTVAALPSSNIAILGVQTVLKATKTGTDPATVSFGPQGDLGAAQAMTQDEYRYYHSISEIDPSTTNPWLLSDVNSLIVELERVE